MHSTSYSPKTSSFPAFSNYATTVFYTLKLLELSKSSDSFPRLQTQMFLGTWGVLLLLRNRSGKLKGHPEVSGNAISNRLRILLDIPGSFGRKHAVSITSTESKTGAISTVLNHFHPMDAVRMLRNASQSFKPKQLRGRKELHLKITKDLSV